MKITKSQLKQIIKEELENVLNEGLGGDCGVDYGPPGVPEWEKRCPNAGVVDLGRHPEFGWLGEACLCDKDDEKERYKARNDVIMRRTGHQQEKDWVA